jgi:hypothetical protein
VEVRDIFDVKELKVRERLFEGLFLDQSKLSSKEKQKSRQVRCRKELEVLGLFPMQTPKSKCRKESELPASKHEYKPCQRFLF